MRYSFIKEILRAEWMIDPAMARAEKPILVGMMNGLEFSPEASRKSYFTTSSEVPNKCIHVLEISGTMLRNDGDCGFVGTKTLARLLLSADEEPKVYGHILKIDSGGGAANSVPDLSEAIQNCRKPVVAYVDGFMASAAMYVGSYCNHIIAHDRSDRIGCIGVMVEIEDYPKNHRSQDGLVSLRIYADESGEKNAEYEAALEGDFSLLKTNILNPLAKQFCDDIRTNRKYVPDEQLKGRTYFASEVVGTLIDEIGDFDTAVRKVKELSNLNITTNMEGLTNLQSIESCKELVMVDGSVSLNQEQLNDIDARLNETNEIPTLRQQLEAKQQRNTALNTEADGLKQTITERDKRIAELEARLESGRPAGVSTVYHTGNPSKEEDDFKESTDEEAAEYCRKVINNEI